MMAPPEKSIMFFIMMLDTLLARVRPASTRAKPTCMKIDEDPRDEHERVVEEYLRDVDELLGKQGELLGLRNRS